MLSSISIAHSSLARLYPPPCRYSHGLMESSAKDNAGEDRMKRYEEGNRTTEIHKNWFRHNPKKCGIRAWRSAEEPSISSSFKPGKSSSSSSSSWIDSTRFYFLYLYSHLSVHWTPPPPPKSFYHFDSLSFISAADEGPGDASSRLPVPHANISFIGRRPFHSLSRRRRQLKSLQLNLHSVHFVERLGKLQWQFVWIANKFNDSNNYRAVPLLSPMILGHVSARLAYLAVYLPTILVVVPLRIEMAIRLAEEEEEIGQEKNNPSIHHPACASFHLLGHLFALLSYNFPDRCFPPTGLGIRSLFP